MSHDQPEILIAALCFFAGIVIPSLWRIEDALKKIAAAKRDDAQRAALTDPKTVHAAMQNAPIDDKPYRQARAAIACIAARDEKRLLDLLDGAETGEPLGGARRDFAGGEGGGVIGYKITHHGCDNLLIEVTERASHYLHLQVRDWRDGEFEPEPIATGSIDWEGCIDLTMDGLIHTCNRDDDIGLAYLFGVIRSIAAELLYPAWDDGVPNLSMFKNYAFGKAAS